MKKAIALILTALLVTGLLTGCTESSDSPPSAPETSDNTSQALTAQSVALEVGNMEVYDFGGIKLHAYETKDPISNENFLLETDSELILIELAPFYENINELQKYIEEIGKPLNSVIVAYHPAGGDAYLNSTIYASEGLGEAGLVSGFVESFGDIFNGSLPTQFELVTPGTITIGGVDFIVTETADAFDLEIPAINIFLTHMVGSNTHNILASVEHIDATIAEMRGYQAKEYALILTGHDVPRTIEVAAEKIGYLEETKALVLSCATAEEFIAAMNAAFPDYAGSNYLEMSAGMIYG